jgi:hypothetical protein
VIKDKFKNAVCNKGRSLLLKTVLLHLTREPPPHVAAVTMEAVQKVKFEVLPCPPYCPNLAVCDFHVFGPLKEALHGCWFGSDEVKEVVHK